MADIQYARIVGDWRRVVGDEIVSYENTDIGDVGIHGTVTLSPVWARGGPQGIVADPGAYYSIHPVVCRVRYGRLYDPTNTVPYEDVAVEIDGQPLVWKAKFELAFRRRAGEAEVPLQVREVTFDNAAVVAGEIALTGILPASAIPAEYQAYFANAALSATVADGAKATAVEAAGTATTAASTASSAAGVADAKAAAAAASVTLAAQEADRAVGLANAQDEHIAGTLANPASATHAAFKAVGNATYADRASLPVSILDYAAPDGTNQTTNVQAAVNAAAGGTLSVPPGSMFRVDGTITVTSPVTIMSSGRGGFYSQSGTTTQDLFNVTSSNVHFRGIRVVGPQFDSVATQRGIVFKGATPTAPLKQVSVIDCELSKWSHFGIIATFVEGFQFDNNDIFDIAYAGAATMSCSYGSMDNNRVRNVTQPSGYVNSYGLSASRGYGTLTGHPRSAHITFRGNRIADVPNWAGIDTHGGQDLLISHNVITNCDSPISCVSSRDASNTNIYAPLDIVITENTAHSGRTNGTLRSINLVGNAVEKATGRISGNYTRGHGVQNNSQGNGIQLAFTFGVQVTNNTMVETSPNGILFVNDNVGFTCTGNTIIDVWSDTHRVKAIHLLQDNNSGHIDRNTVLSTGGKAAANLIGTGFGIFVANTASNSAVIGTNSMSIAQLPLYDPGAKAKYGLFGSAGAAKAASPGTASGSDATVVNNLVSALRAYGIVT